MNRFRTGHSLLALILVVCCHVLVRRVCALASCTRRRVTRGTTTPSSSSAIRLPPHSGYHGGSAEPGKPFFEGWYLRVVMPDGDSLAFIYHVFDPHLSESSRRGVGLQVLTPLLDDATTVVVVESPELYRFTARSDRLDIRNLFRGGSRFALTRHRATGVARDDDDTVVDFDLHIRPPLIGWGGNVATDRQYSTAGFLAAFPVFEPHYQVLISKGSATGSVTVRNHRHSLNRRYDFDDATVYLEKNWGASFPSAWWWIQANTGFDCTDTLCVTSTGGRRKLPLTRQEEDVGFVALHFGGEFLPFPSCQWDNQWGLWNVTGDFEDYSVQLTGSCELDDGFPVRCPTERGMRGIAKETFRGVLRVQLHKGGRLILDTTTDQACLETGGLPWKNDRWRGSSELAEPYRSVVLNQRLERFGADVLSVVNKIFPIPGL